MRRSSGTPRRRAICSTARWRSGRRKTSTSNPWTTPSSSNRTALSWCSPATNQQTTAAGFTDFFRNTCCRGSPRSLNPRPRLYARFALDLLDAAGVKPELVSHNPRRRYLIKSAIIPSLPAPHVYLRPEIVAALRAMVPSEHSGIDLGERLYVSADASHPQTRVSRADQ